MGIVVEIDHDGVAGLGENIKYRSIPDDISQKPENLYVRGILTERGILDIDASSVDTGNITADLSTLDVTTPGEYTVKLTATDYAGNTSEAEVTVKVE